MHELFVTCSTGMEGLLQEELGELGFQKLRAGFRGVHVEEVDPEAIYRINYCSRIAGRVLLPLKKFRCTNVKALYQEISTIDWMSYIAPGKTFAIDANVTHRQLRNSLFAAQVVKDAICDQFRAKTGQRPSVNTKNPDVQLNLFIREPWAIISFDTSGIPLYKRGYRQDAVEAPMQETLAAALLRIAGYRSEVVLCDPCCGSGTLLIEAALIASQTPPGFLRQKWGFTDLPEYSARTWNKVKAEADSKRQNLSSGHFLGCDINKNAVRICKGNVRIAGFHQAIEVVSSDFKEFSPSVLPNWVIANPPHGRRLEEVESLKSLYRSLGEFMKQKTAKPAKGFVFTGSMDLAKEVGLAPTRRHVVDNSGIESRFLEFDLY